VSAETPEPPEPSEPTKDELLAMAYVDGELSGAERAAFDERLAREPLLAREVAELRSLELLSRHAAPPEPADHEWSRLARSPLSRTLGPLSWALIAIGTLGLGIWSIVRLARAELSLVPKVLALALVAGVVLRLLLALRQRARTLPYDPYTRVKR
jgi:anti-sigma factor RsiW